MTVSRLLKSCAMPPARRPTASIFCAWRSWSARRLLSVISVITATTAAGIRSFPSSGAAEILTSIDAPSFLWHTVSTVSDSPRRTAWMICNRSTLSPSEEGRGRPRISSSLQPNIFSAAEFHLETFSEKSKAIMASGVASIKARRVSLASRKSSSARRRALISRRTQVARALDSCVNSPTDTSSGIWWPS